MANNRNGQQYSSEYAPLEQEDSTFQHRLSANRFSQFSRPVQENDSVSSIHYNEDDAYELSSRRNLHSGSAGPSRSISAATGGVRKEPPVTVREDAISQSPKKEWKSWKIKWLFTTIALVVEVALIGIIIGLEQISTHRGGIATVPDHTITPSGSLSFSSSNAGQYLGLLWTSLPAFLFSLYGLAFAAVVATCYERQPFIEIRRGSTLRKTIMLDYRAYPGFYNWIMALKYGHRHLAFAMLLSFIVSIAIVPLSSRLLVASAYSQSSEISLNFTSRFDDSILIERTNLQPFINLATAIHGYGSVPPAWMTAEYAFAPFSASNLSSENSSAGTSVANITTTTDAYSGYLDCRAIDSGSFTYVNSSDPQIIFKVSDRACSFSVSIPVSNLTQTYAQSWQGTCEERGSSRTGLIAGSYSSSSANKLNNISLISCISSYWHITGLLTLSVQGASMSRPSFVSFIEQNSTIMDPLFGNRLEHLLPQFWTFDATATTRSDSFGFAILSAARRSANNDGVAALNTTLLLNAMQRVFTTMYAGLAATSILVPVPRGARRAGTLSQAVTRLFIVRFIAYTIVAVLFSVLISHLILWIYSIRHPSVLSEESMGLLSSAIQLERSDVGTVLTETRNSGESHDVRLTLKERFNVEQARCFWDEGENRIRVEGLARK